jgi:DNA-binding MarR family transcriptional regulator
MGDDVSTRGRQRDAAVPAWMRLMRVYQQISRVAGEQVRGAGLSLAQFDALAQIGAAAGRPQQDLADALLVTKGNVTQLLDRMEADGLLVRRQVGRTKCVSLTPKGQQLRDAVLPQHEAVIAAQLDCLTAEERHQLLRLLGKVDRSLRERYGPPERVAPVEAGEPDRSGAPEPIDRAGAGGRPN